MKKNGIVIDCSGCRCVASDGSREFDIDVPITDIEGNVTGTAAIHGSISDEGHALDLVAVRDDEDHIVEVDENTAERIGSTLDFFAERRICGHAGICPYLVNELATKDRR